MLYGEYGTRVPENESVAQRQKPLLAFDVARSVTAADPFSSEISDLMALGFSKPLLFRLKLLAIKNGSCMEDELLNGAFVDPAHYYEAMARHLKLSFMPTVPDGLIFDSDNLDSQLVSPRVTRLHRMGKPPALLIIPKAGCLGPIHRMLTESPNNRFLLMVTTPGSLKQAVWSAGAKRRVQDTVLSLANNYPILSARDVIWGRQGFWAGIAASAFVATFALAPVVGLLSLRLGLSFIYLFSLLLRICALTMNAPKPAEMPMPEGPYPIYSVLVPLYRETHVSHQLVKALKALHWPTSRLDIKLICENDDHETIAALRSHALGPHFEIVEVPAMNPRTKPKALSYAMAGVRGDFLVIYDAEDIPHPDQLREAYAAFLKYPKQIACLQSPLNILNAGKAWITTLFALEYTGLFRTILPLLARFQMPLPLGGTSNHFRVDALRESCGWDPFNVTEDADLGIRLHRMGFRSQVLRLPTYESAPDSKRIWIGQRKRWFKGWMQTLLVHLRQPVLFAQQTGWKAAGVFVLMIGGGLISALAHPLVFFSAAYSFFLFASGGSVTGLDAFLLFLDMTNLIASYFVFFLLGKKGLSRSPETVRSIFLIPVYWLLMAYAAWLAVLELLRKPHHWEKTSHKPNDETAVSN